MSDVERDNPDGDMYALNLSERGERKVKRGRGRPRKPPAAEEEEVVELANEEVGKPRPDAKEAPEAEGDENKKKANLIRIINDLKKKLNAVGTGMVPSLQHTVEDMETEVELLNNDLNSKRGDKAVKALILYAMPLIEMAVSRTVPKEQLDLSTKFHLKDEVEQNWEIFEDAATHIAILHADWFAVGPYATLVKSTAACAASCNAKNQAARKAVEPPAPEKVQ